MLEEQNVKHDDKNTTKTKWLCKDIALKNINNYRLKYINDGGIRGIYEYSEIW